MAKVSFDPYTKLITVLPGILRIDVKVDLYSDWKEWALLNNQYLPAIRAVGGDIVNPTTGEQTGTTFFTTNGWRVYLDHSVQFDGNLFSDDFVVPYLAAPGLIMVQDKVSTLVEKPDTSEIAADLWDTPTANVFADGSMGEFIRDKLLSVKKFLSFG